jgi:hypothetical protein
MKAIFLNVLIGACALALGTLQVAGAQDRLQSEPPPNQKATPGVGDGPETEITAEHEVAVEKGLAWLASQQNDDGSWTGKIGRKLNNGYDYTRESGHVGVTSLACIAFLAGGHQPGRGKYGQAIESGLDFVLAACQEDGYVTVGGTRMYSHAFATLFLAEIFGMTHREDVRLKLQKAVDFIVTCQNEEGGWRYVPLESQSDMSIVVCQVIALRAARNIGIRVPKETVDRASAYVKDSANGMGSSRGRSSYLAGSFKYQKEGATRSSFPLTSAGVTALNGLGIYSDDRIAEGLSYLQRNIGAFNYEYGIRGGAHYFYWYGHYYGVQAMYMAGEPYWTPYFKELRGELLQMQSPNGSFPNQVGPGETFGTAMAVLILEIPYRFLPIFQR